MDVPLRHWAFIALLPLVLSPLAVKAQEAKSLYGTVSGVYVVPRDSELSVPELPGVSVDLEMDPGFGLLTAMGYGGRTGFRSEIEFGYRKNDFDQILGQSLTGDLSTMSLMVNSIYVMEAERMRPYFGAGTGFVRHDFAGYGESDDDVVFGYQGMAGIIVPMESAELRFGYRYFATTDGDFEGISASYGSHNFEAGIAFRF